MADIIVHAGMHKTGSSSIQATFFNLAHENIKYVPFRGPNHSALYEHLTNDQPENYGVFARRGLSPDELQEMKNINTDLFTSFLRDLKDIGIFSAESLGSSRFPEKAYKLAALIHEFGHTPRVIIYIRPPISFMQSVFQQRLKSGLSEIDLYGLWPKYRQRVEKLDNAFGIENVTVRPFHPWVFPQKDVVRDFAEFIGIHLDDNQIKRTNEGLSAEAAALLYLQRKFGQGLESPSSSAPKRNLGWISQLNTIGAQKFCFAPGWIEPVVSEFRSDLDWIEERMGCVLEDRKSSAEVEIGSEDDLIKLGLQQLPKVEALLRETLDTLEAPRRRKLVQLLEALRALN